jgi:hypothetical protein
MIRRGTAAAVAAVSALALLATATPASLGSPAATPSADTESLVAYLPAGKLKVAKRISYRFECSAACQVTATSTLVLKGPNLGPAVDTGMFAAGETGVVFLKPNRTARQAITSHLGASKLSASISATDAAGATDTDRRTFRFKR